MWKSEYFVHTCMWNWTRYLFLMSRNLFLYGSCWSINKLLEIRPRHKTRLAQGWEEWDFYLEGESLVPYTGFLVVTCSSLFSSYQFWSASARSFPRNLLTFAHLKVVGRHSLKVRAAITVESSDHDNTSHRHPSTPSTWTGRSDSDSESCDL